MRRSQPFKPLEVVNGNELMAAYKVDLLEYLKTHEPNSIRKCGKDEYCLVDHDSLKISNGKWNWFSRGFGGHNAVDFLVKVRGYSEVAAIKLLADDFGDAKPRNEHPPPKAVIGKTAKTTKPLTLPPANVNNDRAVAYLRGRGIDKDVIKRCVAAGMLYESRTHNVTFVGFDGNDPKFACERGTTDEYKKDVSGSSKAFSFCLPPEKAGSTVLMCCEAPIDVLSAATVSKMAGHGWDGYTVTKTYMIDGKIASIHTCWTQKGRMWLYNVLKSQ